MFLTTIFALLLLGSAGKAETDPVYTLQRISSPIILDGVPDEAAWQDITPFPLTMYHPIHRGEMTQFSEIKVAYESNTLLNRSIPVMPRFDNSVILAKYTYNLSSIVNQVKKVFQIASGFKIRSDS